ncbi:MAG: transcription antitermination factor NusB [Armatimonadota bacterium]
MKHRQRHLGRELALRWLFEIEATRQPPEVVMENVPLEVEELEAIEEEGVTFARELVRGVLAHRAAIDEVIVKYAKGWPIDRMAAIERNILRISLHEIMNVADIPDSVSVDEAVEIAKHYASDESGKFVNGILGAYLRGVPGEEE